VEENFIPWSMIEPLLEEGMTFSRLCSRVLTKVGLPLDGSYRLQTVLGRADWEPLNLRGGVRVITREQGDQAHERGSRISPTALVR